MLEQEGYTYSPQGKKMEVYENKTFGVTSIYRFLLIPFQKEKGRERHRDITNKPCLPLMIEPWSKDPRTINAQTQTSQNKKVFNGTTLARKEGGKVSQIKEIVIFLRLLLLKFKAYHVFSNIEYIS